MNRYEQYKDKPESKVGNIIKGVLFLGVYLAVGTMSFYELTGGF